jgi:sialate O-acetylesterase
MEYITLIALPRAWRMAAALLLASMLIFSSARAADNKPLPKKDVVDVPAIGPGLCVSNVFQSNMVLQRDKPLNIWGWAEPGETVTVSFAGQEAQANAGNDRTWQITLKPVPANNDPQVLTVAGKSASLKLENILVGDVWVLGGQSNMEFPIANVDDGELEIVSANFPRIRLLTMPGGKGFDSVRSFERLHEYSDWASRHYRKGDWEICSPETVKEFSAIGYVFGRRIHMASGIPIGLIDASIGGTTVETWTPEEVLKGIDGAETRAMMKDWADRIAAYDPQADLKTRQANFQNRVKNLQAKGQPAPPKSEMPTDLRPGPVADRNRPGHCFAGVIKPLHGLATAGAVWHQGFNNAFNGSEGARMYYQVLGKMIGAWRANFADPQLPFCIISLCTAGEPQTMDNFLPPMFDAGIYIREAHYQTFRDLRAAGDKQIGFASSFDLRKSWYHPQIKIPAGERAARWAIATRYNLIKSRDAENFWLPPTIEKVDVVDGQLRLTMSTEVRTREDADGRMVGFAIAGEDRRFYPADANWLMQPSKSGGNNKPEPNRKVIVLSSRFVTNPAHYRYAWARNPMGNIVNNQNVPLAAQRSDTWVLEETPVQPPTSPNTPPEVARRQAGNMIRRELERDDMERRVREAEALIAELKPRIEKYDKEKHAAAAKTNGR